MPVEPKRMPFLQHFYELRKRLTVIAVVLFVFALIFYMTPVFKFLMGVFLAPVKAYLPGGKLTVLGPFEEMTFRFKVAFFAALIASMPVLLYEIFAFLTPALKPHEKKWIFPTVVVAVLLFASGVSFAYFVILTPAFQWLSSQGAGVVDSLASASQYFSGIGLLLVGFGIAFELPLVVFYLIGLNIIKYDKLREVWRYVYVIIIIVASIATPDWSPWTMGGLSVALIVLYEASLAAARVVYGKRIEEQRKEDAEYEADYATDESDSDESKKTRKQKLIERAVQEKNKKKE
ncbi:MAG: twin-arginine translocase subunit TatC [Coriobacteriia bacterium]|nr:twin-arginine translocase subunit TatC [Coriobacteriia bacterium]